MRLLPSPTEFLDFARTMVTVWVVLLDYSTPVEIENLPVEEWKGRWRVGKRRKSMEGEFRRSRINNFDHSKCPIRKTPRIR
jgi:hypothetical protein